jgi:hypothetical protein
MAASVATEAARAEPDRRAVEQQRGREEGEGGLPAPGMACGAAGEEQRRRGEVEGEGVEAAEAALVDQAAGRGEVAETDDEEDRRDDREDGAQALNSPAAGR